MFNVEVEQPCALGRIEDGVLRAKTQSNEMRQLQLYLRLRSRINLESRKLNEKHIALVNFLSNYQKSHARIAFPRHRFPAAKF